MQEADPVRGVQRRRILLDDFHGPVWIQGAAGQDMLQVLTVDQPHVHIQPAFDLPEVVNRYHVGIVEARRGVGLSPKPLFEQRVGGQLRRQNLDGHHPLGGSAECLPNLAHAAPAQEFDQLVPAERRSLHNASARQRQTTGCTAITIGCRLGPQRLLQTPVRNRAAACPALTTRGTRVIRCATPPECDHRRTPTVRSTQGSRCRRSADCSRRSRSLGCSLVWSAWHPFSFSATTPTLRRHRPRRREQRLPRCHPRCQHRRSSRSTWSSPSGTVSQVEVVSTSTRSSRNTLASTHCRRPRSLSSTRCKVAISRSPVSSPSRAVKRRSSRTWSSMARRPPGCRRWSWL